MGEQLLLLAIFVGFALVQALIRRWQSQQQGELEQQAPPEVEPSPEVEQPPPRPTQRAPYEPRVPPPAPRPTQQPLAYEPSVLTPAPLVHQVTASPRPAAEPRRRAPQLAPARLIVPRDRAGLQRAVALMVILGPPRALDPPK